MNEKIVTKQFDYNGMNYDIVSYQYDFNNFKDSTLDKKEVLANPEKYIDYEPTPPTPPEKDPTVMERIETLEENQQTVIDALAEIIGGA